jgi:hypothetical protein
MKSAKELIMASQFVEGPPRVVEVEKRSVHHMRTGSLVETLAAAGAVVLAILGLAGLLPTTMMTVGTILLGAAVLFQGGAVAARHRRLIEGTAEPGAAHLHAAVVHGGLSAESLAGIAGIALGIIALLGAIPITLCAVALIAIGAAEVFGSGATHRFSALPMQSPEAGSHARHWMHGALSLSAGAQLFVGVGAVVLGILALLGLEPMSLVLVGILAVGGALLLGGSAIGARAIGILQHSHG